MYGDLMKNSMKIAVCGIATALSVTLLFLGGAVFVFIYIMPMITGLFMIMLRKTFGTSSAVISYVATSLLSAMLVPEKECMLMYVLIFGYYPIIYPKLLQMKSKILSWFFKLMIFNLTVAVVQLVLIYVFEIPFLSEGEGIAVVIIFAVLMNFLFIIYDFSVKMISVLYEQKLEKRIKRFFK